MRIAHIVSTYPPYKGGMGNVAFEMVEELKKKGHETGVITPAYDKSGPDESAQNIFRIKPSFKYGNSAFVPKMYSMLNNYDVLHLHYPFFGGAETVAKFKKKNPQIPLIISYHMDVEGAGLLRIFFKYYNKLFFPRIINKADKILVSSLDYAQNSNILKVSQFENIIELPFGAHEAYAPSLNRNYAKDETQILFVGGLDKAHYFKGLEYLIKSLKFVDADLRHNKNKNKFLLNIVGDGALRKKYEKMVFENKVEQYVAFLGKVSDEDLIYAYQNADVTVLPSVDRSEAFGLVLIESMACGTPVIASDLPGVRSVVDDGVTGYLVKPKSAPDLATKLLHLIKNREVLQKMRVASEERANSKYRWPVIIEQLEKIYQDCLK